MQIKGSTFVISGGSSGLGLATAKHLIALGGNAVLADVNEKTGAAAVAELGKSARFARTDVTSEADCNAAVALAVKEFGALHGAVNCAGVGNPTKVLGKDGVHPLDNFTRVVGINLIGSFNLLRLAVAQMQHNAPNADGERGVVINTASVAAYDGQIGQAAYASSKAGVVGMTLPIARELARFGIRVATIAPGIFWTPMVDSMPEAVQQSLSASIPFPSRLGQPGEYASTVAFILGNRYINGETIRLDGAVRLQPK